MYDTILSHISNFFNHRNRLSRLMRDGLHNLSVLVHAEYNDGSAAVCAGFLKKKNFVGAYTYHTGGGRAIIS